MSGQEWEELLAATFANHRPPGCQCKGLVIYIASHTPRLAYIKILNDILNNKVYNNNNIVYYRKKFLCHSMQLS